MEKNSDSDSDTQSCRGQDCAAPGQESDGLGRRTFTLDEAIVTIGIGTFQYALLAYVGLAWISDAMEVSLQAAHSLCRACGMHASRRLQQARVWNAASSGTRVRHRGNRCDPTRLQMMILSFVGPSVKCQFQTTPAEESHITSVRGARDAQRVSAGTCAHRRLYSLG